MVILSVTGVLKIVLIIIGVTVLLRFFGKLAIAKRQIDENNRLRREEQKAAKLAEEARRNYGKVSIESADRKSNRTEEYTDFEEIE